MHRILGIAVVAATVAFGASGFDVQGARAQSQPTAKASHPPSDVKTKTVHRRERVPPQPAPENAAAPAEAAPEAPVVFLSDAWLKQEKQTDERLKEFMTICKGC